MNPSRSFMRSSFLPLAVLAVVAVGFVAAPFLLKPYGIYILSLWAVMSIAAVGLNLTLGYVGQISLAQAAFVGIGAYVVALLTPAGWPYPLAFLASGLLCFGIGWLLGYPALRVQHHYLAFVTLAFSTLAFLVMRNEEWLTGGIYGLQVQRPTILGWSTRRAPDFYYLTLGILTLVTAAVWGMIRSPWGRAFMALRENPLRALSLGVDTRRYTLLAFAIGSGLGGLSGALYAPLVQFIEPNAFALGLSLSILLMVIVGGAGFFLGPFVGALVSVLLPEWLRLAEGYYLMAYAVIVMLLLAFSPTGLVGLADRWIRKLRSTDNTAEPAPVSATMETLK
jgi:branched-chain amino acid transport system permease protein